MTKIYKIYTVVIGLVLIVGGIAVTWFLVKGIDAPEPPLRAKQVMSGTREEVILRYSNGA